MIDLAVGPSLHLTWKELACHNGIEYPEIWRRDRALVVAGVFELIREITGGNPITILSAYRTPNYNAIIGGAKNSQHTQGRAIDLRPPQHMSLDDFYNKIRSLTKVSAIRGIGKYKTFVHVDVRPGDHVALWYGAGVNG